MRPFLVFFVVLDCYASDPFEDLFIGEGPSITIEAIVKAERKIVCDSQGNQILNEGVPVRKRVLSNIFRKIKLVNPDVIRKSYENVIYNMELLATWYDGSDYEAVESSTMRKNRIVETFEKNFLTVMANFAQASGNQLKIDDVYDYLTLKKNTNSTYDGILSKILNRPVLGAKFLVASNILTRLMYKFILRKPQFNGVLFEGEHESEDRLFVQRVIAEYRQSSIHGAYEIDIALEEETRIAENVSNAITSNSEASLANINIALANMSNCINNMSNALASTIGDLGEKVNAATVANSAAFVGLSSELGLLATGLNNVAGRISSSAESNIVTSIGSLRDTLGEKIDAHADSVGGKLDILATNTETVATNTETVADRISDGTNGRDLSTTLGNLKDLASEAWTAIKGPLGIAK
jgi:hypothetical protein